MKIVRGKAAELLIKRIVAEAIGDAERKRRTYKSTAVGRVAGQAELKDIARELGFSVSGAKQAIDKAVAKLRFVMQLDDEERDEIVLRAVRDYIDELSGTIDASDPDAPSESEIQLMYDNPSIVMDLDGFREFLHPYIKRAAEAKGTRIDRDVARR